MSKPIVILVPAYRCETAIAQTLESIQEQGPCLGEIREVIIADDGSHDGGADVALKLWKSTTPMRILRRQFNCGEYASVNNAVDQFPEEIEWFLIMHADNFAKPGWLSSFLRRIEDAGEHVGVIGSSYDYFDDAGHTWTGENDSSGSVVTVPGTRKAVSDTLKRGCWWHISSCAIRVRAYTEVGGLPKIMQLKGDWDFMLRILAAGWTIEHMPISLMMYRENRTGSSSITFRRHMDIWETMTVVGRFHWALSASDLVRLHAVHIWYVVRRIFKSLLRMDGVRFLWAFPAIGCVIASFWTAATDPARKRSRQVSTKLVSTQNASHP
jgi:glycosyltransferase involved in cell wall biosynthesis